MNDAVPKLLRNPRLLAAAGLLLVGAVLAAAVSKPGPRLVSSKPGPRPVPLFVHGGAGLRPALDEIASVFTAETGIPVEYSYKGSGCLLTDIAMSQKGDLYVPGEDFYMEQARRRGFVETDALAAAMSLVLVVQTGNPLGIKELKDLGRPGLRVGLGDCEAVAAGRAAHLALHKAGVLEAVMPNVVMSALNVIELGNAVKLGHLDAALVWDATAALYPPTALTAIPLPAEQRVESPIPVAVLRFAKSPAEARRLMEFMRGEKAAQIWRKHGYGASPAGGPTALAAKTAGP